jgi:hypothetical protein
LFETGVDKSYTTLQKVYGIAFAEEEDSQIKLTCPLPDVRLRSGTVGCNPSESDV